MKVKNALRAEFLEGKTLFSWLFLAFGILLQVFAIVYGYVTGTPDSVASIISGLTGIVSVVLCAEGKISFYAFGYVQLLTYVFGVAIPNHLYGEIWENVFYFITMIYGTYVWAKNYQKKENGSTEIISKRLNKTWGAVVYAVMVIGIGVLTVVLKNTNDPVPFFDAVTTVPAMGAQILMMLGYRDQWVGWIIEDIASLIMFIILGNWVMVAQYTFWTINCIYGWVKWSRQ